MPVARSLPPPAPLTQQLELQHKVMDYGSLSCLVLFSNVSTGNAFTRTQPKRMLDTWKRHSQTVDSERIEIQLHLLQSNELNHC